MNRFTFLRLAAILIVLVAIVIGCSGGGDPTSPNNPPAGNAFLAVGDITREGNFITVPLEFSDAQNIYAMSWRVGFDERCLRPVDVNWDDIVSDQDSRFHKMDCRGYVPMAVAMFGRPDGLNDRGTLCRLRFEVMQEDCSMPWIVNDERYLIAKNMAGRPVRLRVGGGPR